MPHYKQFLNYSCEQWSCSDTLWMVISTAGVLQSDCHQKKWRSHIWCQHHCSVYCIYCRTKTDQDSRHLHRKPLITQHTHKDIQSHKDTHSVYSMEEVLKCCGLHFSSGTTGACTNYRIHHPWSITWIVALTYLNIHLQRADYYVCVAGQQCTQRTTTSHSQCVTDNLPLSSPVHLLSITARPRWEGISVWGNYG